MALRDQVGKIAADLRAKMRAPGDIRTRAEQLHADEQVAEDFDVWTDLLSRRAAVLWVLKSVYVRVLEDRGLLRPGRLLDLEAQQLFERLAPNLGETAFLRWIYRDLASPHGGLPELFSRQPAEVAFPSDDLSRGLIAFWRHRDADTGATWSFAEEHFEGELMGDLYQELDPLVKERFALCQTPGFVRAFILDRTLTPAIETFGADEVRLLDPACGSGHFLIDGLKRLVAAAAAKHPDWECGKVVTHALDRVVGVDLNDYACALARARLIMTAAELAGVTSLAQAARFHPHVYWADGLEQVECEEQKPSLQYALFEKVEEKPRATLTRSDARAALRKVFATKFHAVVANPPYITEKDEARKEYHREKIGKKQRYVSAYREYSLGSPFTERCFKLAAADGYVGIITGNNFMKREFGKPLIETVLAGLELTLVVDSSQAHIPHHGTSTVLLFGRNRRPVAKTVRAVMGRRGESSTPEDPAEGRVWSSVIEGWDQLGFQNDYVSVAEVPRETLNKHPWSLGGGGAAELQERLEHTAEERLRAVASEIGFVCMTRADEIYFTPREALRRARIDDAFIAETVSGDRVRDWAIAAPATTLFPYDSDLQPVSENAAPAVHRFLWPYRALLWLRREPNGNHRELGLTWWEWSRFQRARFRRPFSIAFAEVATHNHFVFDRGGKVFNRTAPVIKLPAGASEDEHLALVGLLNSSVADFWMKQVFQVKGGVSTGKKRQSEAWSRRIARDGTKLANFPVIRAERERVIELARRLDALARQFAGSAARSVFESNWAPESIERILGEAHQRRGAIRNEMVALQEELDWTTYVAYRLAPAEELTDLEAIAPMSSEHRPFAIRLARASAAGATNYWFEAMSVQPTMEVPDDSAPAVRERVRRRLALIETDPLLGILESPEFKRKWEPSNWREEVCSAAFSWLASRLESTVALRDNAVSQPHLVAAVQDDAWFLAAAAIHQDRRDVDLGGLVAELLNVDSVPSHRFHVYTESGLAKRAAWEDVWRLQRREDAGEKIEQISVPPEYSQGSRGKSIDFLRQEYWHLRGKLDVPRERFIAFTDVPGRTAAETPYGWAGWAPAQRVKAILAMDEELEDASVPLADRVGLLDSAWRLLPDVAREDAAAANRLKAELQALVGPEGPSRELIEDWKKRFPPPTTRAPRARKAAAAREARTTITARPRRATKHDHHQRGLRASAPGRHPGDGVRRQAA
jgi:hypothetical protein